MRVTSHHYPVGPGSDAGMLRTIYGDSRCIFRMGDYDHFVASAGNAHHELPLPVRLGDIFFDAINFLQANQTIGERRVLEEHFAPELVSFLKRKASELLSGNLYIALFESEVRRTRHRSDLDV